MEEINKVRSEISRLIKIRNGLVKQYLKDNAVYSVGDTLGVEFIYTFDNNTIKATNVVKITDIKLDKFSRIKYISNVLVNGVEQKNIRVFWQGFNKINKI